MYINKLPIILLIGSAGSENSSFLKKVPEELRDIQTNIRGNEQYGKQYIIEYQPNVTKEALSEVLNRYRDQIAIIHFAGHANSKIMMFDDGEFVSKKITDEIKDWAKKPGLVFLNGCNTFDQTDDFLDSGVDCVITTHDAIDDSVASKLAKHFYTHFFNSGYDSIIQSFESTKNLTYKEDGTLVRGMTFPNKSSNTNEWDWALTERIKSPGKNLTLDKILTNISGIGERALTTIWTTLGLVCFLIAILIHQQIQDHSGYIPLIELVNSNCQKIPETMICKSNTHSDVVVGLFGLIYLTIPLLILILISYFFAKDNKYKHWTYKLPTAFNLPINLSSNAAKIYQFSFYILFYILPVYGYGHFLRNMLKGDVFQIGSNEAIIDDMREHFFGNENYTFTNLFNGFQDIFINSNHYHLIHHDGVTFFPIFQTWFFFIFFIAFVILFFRTSYLIFGIRKSKDK